MKQRPALAAVVVLCLTFVTAFAARAQGEDWQAQVKDVFSRYVTQVDTTTAAVQKASSTQDATAVYRDLVKSMAPLKETFRGIAATHPEIKSDKGLGKVLGKDLSKQVERAYTDLLKASMPIVKKSKGDVELKAALDDVTRAITFTGDKG